MRIFANREIRRLFQLLAAIMAGFLLLSQGVEGWSRQKLSLPLLLLSLAAFCCVMAACVWYFRRQDKTMEAAVAVMEAVLSGDRDARIDCDEEGELYRLFHGVNTLSAVLSAHAANELQEKTFLKQIISDISHQLKTPLAALQVYNGLLQGEAEALPAIREFVTLSEQELDRMDTLVQNLLKLARLDAGAIVLEKRPEQVADMMKDVQLHFAYRAGQEGKKLLLSGADEVSLLCDRDWMLEAVDNIVKNALDHTQREDTVRIAWRQFASVVQITVTDNGAGIHPEDLHHIFKRFYRSRFSQDTQGLGLGLPLAKGILEAHNGAIEVRSELGAGTTFVISFLIPTKL